jgi:hypothetical protein
MFDQCLHVAQAAAPLGITNVTCTLPRTYPGLDRFYEIVRFIGKDSGADIPHGVAEAVTYGIFTA